MSAYSSYQQGQIQGKQLELKGRLEQTQYDRRAIQYQQKANQVLERLKKTNATLTAKGFAGGVDPFSGSTDIVRAANETAAGREFKIYLDDADAAIRAGDIALASNLAAAQQAKTPARRFPEPGPMTEAEPRCASAYPITFRAPMSRHEKPRRFGRGSA